jgi:hypothetical protein
MNAAAQPERSNRPFTLLLRVLPRQGSVGRLVGHAEVVETGEVVAIADAADLADLVERESRARCGSDD